VSGAVVVSLLLFSPAIADANYENRPGVNGDDFNTGADGGDNWLIWSNVAPVSGEIRVDFVSSDDWVFVNALRLSKVPEPSTLAALSGLLGMGLISRWWRRRKGA